MCGIAGIFKFNGAQIEEAPDKTRLANAISIIQHRGPDEQGVFCRDGVALAHARLSIIDLDTGTQPLHLPPRNLHLVANGEVYNYLELRQQFSSPDLPYSTASDCESILHCYAHQGVKGFTALHGMYAFALYDAQQQQLILARDRLGIKPLFYAQQNNKLVFGSEIKSVLAQLDSTPAIRPQALLEFLQNQFYSGEETIFEGIKQVLPGHYVTVDAAGSVSSQPYWLLDGSLNSSLANVSASNKSAANKMSLNEAQEAFEPLFKQVMQEHLRSDVPLGLFLSGGIDSGILLSELTKTDRHSASQPLKTFSVGYSGANMEDELSQAEALASQFKTEHVSLQVTREQLFGRIPLSIWAADDLMRDYACLPLLMLAEQASQSLKVVFSGEGGDEAFAGYRRYRSGLEQYLKALVVGAGGLRSSGQLSKSVLNKLLGEPFQGLDFRASIKQAWHDSPSHWTLMQRRQHVDIHTALESNLLVKADRMLMAFGLEGRVPFCDHRIVEFGVNLPDNVKYPAKKGKWLLRQWAQNSLPAEHLSRPKRGFYVPVKEWFSGDFLTQVGQKLVNNRAINAYFRADAIPDIVAAQQQNGSTSRELFCLMQFAIWHQMTHEPGQRPQAEDNPLDWL